MTAGSRLMVKELSLSTWPDFEKLAMKQGGCWCMYYQRPRPLAGKMTKEERAERNRRDKESLVRQGQSHAIIVYKDHAPVGWCQYGVKEELPRIDARQGYRGIRSPPRGKKLWRITCFFVDKDHRGQGVARTALRGAIESITRQGGGVVEAYPVVSGKGLKDPTWMWSGSVSMFRRQGFKHVAPLNLEYASSFPTSYKLMRKSIPLGNG